MVGTSSDFDVVLDLCRVPQRRAVLTVLVDQQRTLSIDDLTRAVITHAHDTAVTEVSDETVSQTKTSLYHVHVPKLEAAGLVEYDAERQLLEPTPELDRIEPHLSAIVEADPELATPPEL